MRQAQSPPLMGLVIVGFCYKLVCQINKERGQLLRERLLSHVHDSNSGFLFYVEYKDLRVARIDCGKQPHSKSVSGKTDMYMQSYYFEDLGICI